MKLRVNFTMVFLLFLMGLLLGLTLIHAVYQQVPFVLQGDNLLQRNTFGQFVAVNSVREHRKDWIEDQYQVAEFHRVFGMDSYVFTGEEIITRMKGAFFTVDLSIPHDRYPEDRIGFNPAKGAGGFDFDTFLLRMKEKGIKTIPVLARNLLYANVPQDSVINVWQLPYDEGGDDENPMDYKAYASFLYQFAARYGQNGMVDHGGTIKPGLLKVAANNTRRAGLDLIYAIEPGNEMDKRWFGEKEYASPEELAAFMSAAIDGHMGLMGEGHGILAADPAMKIVLPSPVEVKYGYVSDVLQHLKELRKEAPERGYDVLPEKNLIMTAHTYPFDEHKLKEASTIVENTSIFEKSYDYVNKIREICDCPVYLTEIGYDKVTGNRSPMGTPVNPADPKDTEDISTHAQAKHILRALFTTYAAGYDKTFLFTLKDPVPVGGKGFRTKFATSGLIRKNGQKDLAWYELDFLRKKLYDHRLTFAYLSQPVNFLRLESDKEIALVYWLGSNENDEKSLQWPGGGASGKAELFDLSRLSDTETFESTCMELNAESLLAFGEFPSLMIIQK